MTHITFFQSLLFVLLQKLDPAQLRKIQSVDGGLGIPVARNCSGVQSPKMSNGTGNSHAPPKPPSGPTLIEEPFKKVKKPIPQSRSSTPAPSNGLSKPDTDKRSNSEVRGLPSSTSLKSLSDSSSADTSESKVSLCRLVCAV